MRCLFSKRNCQLFDEEIILQVHYFLVFFSGFRKKNLSQMHCAYCYKTLKLLLEKFLFQIHQGKVKLMIT